MNLALQNPNQPDPSQSLRIYFWMPRSEVVFFQAIFDAHEGLGRVRTERHDDRGRSLILVLTTHEQENIVRDFLRQIQPEISGALEFV